MVGLAKCDALLRSSFMYQRLTPAIGSKLQLPNDSRNDTKNCKQCYKTSVKTDHQQLRSYLGLIPAADLTLRPSHQHQLKNCSISHSGTWNCRKHIATRVHGLNTNTDCRQIRYSSSCGLEQSLILNRSQCYIQKAILDNSCYAHNTKSTASRSQFVAKHPILSCNGKLFTNHNTHLQDNRRHFSTAGMVAFFQTFPPIVYAQQFLVIAHTVTGLPWWATIMLSTITLRTAIALPVAVFSIHNGAKLEIARGKIQGMSKQLRMEVAHAAKEQGWDQNIAKLQFHTNMKRIVRELYIKDNCHPMKSTIIVLVQLPLWICVSLALRNMSGAFYSSGIKTLSVVPSLANEGTLWFSNLLVPDPTFILPVTMALANLTINEMYALRTAEPQKLEKVFTNFMRGFSILMIPIAASVPSCMCLYWTSSSLYGLVQNIIIRYPTVRRALRIPETPSESKTPFKDMVKVAKQKYGRKSEDS